MFESMPVWHVSVARVKSNRTGIKPRDFWTVPEVRDAARIAVKSLDGIGNKMKQWEENGEMAIHIRRQLAQPEIDLLYAIKPDAPVFTNGLARPSGVRP